MVDENPAGKGHATPSRKEAERLRREQMKKPITRKDQMVRERAAKDAARAKQREALKTGNDKYLPAREQGPVRAFARDYVDRRRNLAEYLLPILVIILALSFIGQPWSLLAVTFLWSFTILGTIADTYVLIRRLRRELAARFEPSETKGTVPYSVLRSTQLRRFRLPKPQVSHGEPLKNRY